MHVKDGDRPVSKLKPEYYEGVLINYAGVNLR